MRKEKQSLSVIVPVYNTEKYVRRCLDSILKNQGWSNLEVLVVDDCSPGNIGEIVAEYQKEFPNLKLLRHETNRGLFQARITGLKAASGDYFAFVDSDDWVGVDYFRALMEKAAEADADVVTADHLEAMAEDNSYVAMHNMLTQKDWNLHGTEIIEHLMEQRGLDYGWWVVWNKIYARSLWEKSRSILEGVNEHLIMCEDVAFSVVFLSRAEHLASTHYYYYYYYRSTESSTLAKVDCQKYKKNLADIARSFQIAQDALQASGQWESRRRDWELWRNAMVQWWQIRLGQDTDLAKQDRREIQAILDALLIDPETEPCNLDRTCCDNRSRVFHIYLEEIRKAIVDPETEVVSFDCFDTLVLRPFFEPTDLFHVLDAYVNQMVPTLDFCVFTNIRITAEQRARERKHLEAPAWEDVTLDEIYAEVAQMCPAWKPWLESIKAKEIELEIRYCNPRNIGKELLNCALAHGKRVICTSDMYLPESVIQKILDKNGYRNIRYLYLSRSLGTTKSSGNLYRHVLREEGLSGRPEAMVHIGDNYASDVERAMEQGIRAYHLPKPMDLFRNQNGAIYSGNGYYPIFGAQNGVNSGYSLTEFWGMRCLMAVAANKLFDNPFVFYHPDTDFNGDSYTIGYYLLGMYTFAVAAWLQKESLENQYDNLCFMARDGYLAYHAFEILNAVYHSKTKLHYMHLSRKALLPLMVSQETDFYAMYNNFSLSTLTPCSFLKIATPIVNPEKLKQAKEIVAKYEIPYRKPFGNIVCFMEFGKVFFAEFFDKGRSDAYRVRFGEYMKPQIAGKTATFDVGYSARGESVLRESFGCEVTGYYVHINSDRPIGREQKSGARIKTLYPTSPFITGFIREQMMSAIAPSCLEYREQNGVFGPYFEDVQFNMQTRFIVQTMQDAALEFVSDMVSLFGDDLKYLAYRLYDACIPMEYYLSESKEGDRTMFRGVLFEDDMGMGRNVNMFELWQRELHRWGGTANIQLAPAAVNKIDYYAYPRFKRWLLMFLTDWTYAKKKCYDVLGEKHPHLLNGIIAVYHGARKCYRFITGKNR